MKKKHTSSGLKHGNNTPSGLSFHQWVRPEGHLRAHVHIYMEKGEMESQ